jgi:hypothetical protein
MEIKDRFVLGVISGLAGNAVKMAVDEISLRQRISQRSFRTTAAGVWVSKKKEASSPLGQVLGGIFDFGFASLGGVATVYFLSKTGRDHYLIKGATSGLVLGSFLSALLNVIPNNRVPPKDAASNLSYMLSHLLYGLTTTGVATYLGHPSIFDTSPQDDYLPPTEITTEEKKQQESSEEGNKQRKQQEQYTSMH